MKSIRITFGWSSAVEISVPDNKIVESVQDLENHAEVDPTIEAQILKARSEAFSNLHAKHGEILDVESK